MEFERLVLLAIRFIDRHQIPTTRKLCTTRQFVLSVLSRLRIDLNTLLVALLYLERIHLDDQCGRRLFVAALLVANKILSDQSFSTRASALALGLDFYQLHSLETLLLNSMDHHLQVTPEELHGWVNRIDTEFNCNKILTAF
ncbi:hypothetical protein EDD86DRAFT_210066 [Gorgonomyces haynaldii]|nr:hypothetical protein EDD86DRAFT_210066 [Gorgonomyces haynaldii]